MIISSERKPREYHFKAGDYEAVIYGKGTNHYGDTIRPALRITKNNGTGLFAYDDIHFSQAESVRALRERLNRFIKITGIKLIAQ